MQYIAGPEAFCWKKPDRSSQRRRKVAETVWTTKKISHAANRWCQRGDCGTTIPLDLRLRPEREDADPGTCVVTVSSLQGHPSSLVSALFGNDANLSTSSCFSKTSANQIFNSGLLAQDTLRFAHSIVGFDLFKPQRH